MANSQVAEKEKLDAQTNNQDSVATIVTTENNTIPDSEKEDCLFNSKSRFMVWRKSCVTINLDILENNVTAIIGPSGW